jgi:hypothetical protein
MESFRNIETKAEDVEKIEKLEEYLRAGYLLHGGKKKLETLTPQQATDTDPNRTTGKALAIYAEKHDIRIPIVMALFDRKDPGVRSWRSRYSSHGPDSTMVIGGRNCTFTKGYVYVLPPDTFEREGDESDEELISRAPVTPIDIIEVHPSILNHLKGIDNQMES